MDTKHSQSREQVLQVAESLFMERGYKAVTLKDIAEMLGVKQAALYYHAPGGKEDLYVQVMTRYFERHQAGLEKAIAESEASIEAQLKAIAAWLLSQPPLDLSRLGRSDLPAIAPENAAYIAQLGERAVTEPLRQVLTEAYQRGEIRLVDAMMMSTVFLSIIDTIHNVFEHKQTPPNVLAQDVIDILLNGMRR